MPGTQNIVSSTDSFKSACLSNEALAELPSVRCLARMEPEKGLHHGLDHQMRLGTAGLVKELINVEMSLQP